MVQILLSLIVMVAALVLLVNSWKAEKHLFAVTALVIVLTAGVIAGGLGYQMLRPAALLDPALVEVTLEQARMTENGVRLSGHLNNTSDARIAAVTLEVVVLHCGQTPCEEGARDRIDVLLQIPPGGGYPFNVVARLTDLRDQNELQWRLDVIRVTTY
ncbi:MAG: hypothetical protein ACK4SX_05930 [Alcanivoracaceae bacterium]